MIRDPNRYQKDFGDPKSSKNAQFIFHWFSRIFFLVIFFAVLFLGIHGVKLGSGARCRFGGLE